MENIDSKPNDQKSLSDIDGVSINHDTNEVTIQNAEMVVAYFSSGPDKIREVIVKKPEITEGKGVIAVIENAQDDSLLKKMRARWEKLLKGMRR